MTVAIIDAVIPEPGLARGRVRLGRGLRGRRIYGPRTLTRDDLGKCIRLETAIDDFDADLSEMGSKITAAENAASARERNLESQRAAIKSQAAVENFNRLIDDHNRTLKQLDDQIAAYNARVEESEALLNSFNRDCAQKEYYEDDLESARIELGLPPGK